MPANTNADHSTPGVTIIAISAFLSIVKLKITTVKSAKTTRDVTISLGKSWPPSGIPSGYYVITSTDLNSDNQYSYEFANLDVDSTYMGVAVAWENPDTTYNSSCNKSILGAYGGSISNYFMTVDSFITSTNLENNNFDANINYAVPNPYTVCQPPCVTMTNQPSCESQGHCSWDTTTGCSTKQ